MVDYQILCEALRRWAQGEDPGQAVPAYGTALSEPAADAPAAAAAQWSEDSAVDSQADTGDLGAWSDDGSDDDGAEAGTDSGLDSPVDEYGNRVDPESLAS